MHDAPCQNDTIKNASTPVPQYQVTLAQLYHHVILQGWRFTARRTGKLLVAKLRQLLGLKPKKKVTPAPAPWVNEVLGLQPGELVEVRSEEEIRQTLDSGETHHGLDFTIEMLEYCGRRFRVFKRVEKICLEGKLGEMRKLKNTVLLEGVICNGGSRGCDRACSLFWREAWLKRVPSDN